MPTSCTARLAQVVASDISVSSEGVVAIAINECVVLLDPNSSANPFLIGGCVAKVGFASNGDLWLQDVGVGPKSETCPFGVNTVRVYRKAGIPRGLNSNPGKAGFEAQAPVSDFSPGLDGAMLFSNGISKQVGTWEIELTSGRASARSGSVVPSASAGSVLPPPGDASVHHDEAQAKKYFPNSVALGPDGNIWFTDFVGGYIGVMSQDLRLLAQYPLEEGSKPVRIMAGRDGKMYFIDCGLDRIGAITAMPTRWSKAKAARETRPDLSGAAAQSYKAIAEDVHPAEEQSLSTASDSPERAAGPTKAERREFADRAYAQYMTKLAEQRQAKLEERQATREATAERKRLEAERAAQKQAELTEQRPLEAESVKAVRDEAGLNPAASSSDQEYVAGEVGDDQNDTEGLHSALSVKWDHIRREHFYGREAESSHPVVTQPSTSATVRSESVESVPKSRFHERFSSTDALSGLFVQALKRPSGRVYDPDGRQIVSYTFPNSIGTCWHPSKGSVESSTLKMVVARDGTIITAYPTLRSR